MLESQGPRRRMRRERYEDIRRRTRRAVDADLTRWTKKLEINGGRATGAAAVASEALKATVNGRALNRGPGMC
jgi:hypothetical protein